MTGQNQRQELERSIPFRSFVALGLGVIVGVGWVVYTGEWLQLGGPMGAMLAFLIGGLLLLPIGMCYAELTAALPLAGGELSFSYKAFGSLISFLTAWVLALGYVAVLPFETIAIGTLLETLIPAIVTDPLYFVGTGDDKEHVSLSIIVPGLLIGAYLVWINYHGAKSSARFQMVVVTAMMVCTLVFCGVALFRGQFQNLFPLFSTADSGLPSIAGMASAIISVLVVVPFFMAGFDVIPQAAEESGTKVPPKKLGLAILVSIVSGSVFYVVIILAVAISMPWTTSATLPMTTSAVFEAAFGYTWAVKLVTFTALLGLVTTLNGMYIAASRLIFSLGRGGMLPQWFAGVHSVHHTPKNALLFVGIISLLGPFVGKYALTPIVNTSSLSFTIALVVTCAAAISLRKSSPELERPFRTKVPVLYLGAIVSVILLLLMTLPQSPGQMGNLEFLITGIWVLLGLVAFYWRQSRHPMPGKERDYQILGKFA
ncbi:MAG: APC family permease [Gammaproteobacteria bacterium]|nr:APC family permease [Gammaproteobacteria bacterium]